MLNKNDMYQLYQKCATCVTSCQLPALPLLHNNTTWMQKGNDVF